MGDPLDALNEVLRDVEDAFDERGFRVSAEVDLDEEHRLVYVKLGSEWLLVVKKATETDAHPRTALLKASARLRLAAADALPHLYAALAKANNDRDGATRAATERLKGLVARIRSEATQPEGKAER